MTGGVVCWGGVRPAVDLGHVLVGGRGGNWAGAPGVKVVCVRLGNVLGECVWVRVPYGCGRCAGHGVPLEIICVGAHNVCRVFCSAPYGWFVFVWGPYFCVDVCSVDRASGGPWTAWASW